jgi:uncharacterized protein YndB with AHSA1/START domain
MAAPAEGLGLEVERTLPAAPPIVFAKFTDPGELARWWGPEGFSVPSLDFDPRPGGSYRIEMKPPEGDPFHLSGDFRAVDAPSRLAFTFAWEPPDPDDLETLAELRFDQLDGSTRVSLRQGPFKTEERRTLHRQGWSESFERLERLLAG